MTFGLLCLVQTLLPYFFRPYFIVPSFIPLWIPIFSFAHSFFPSFLPFLSSFIHSIVDFFLWLFLAYVSSIQFLLCSFLNLFTHSFTLFLRYSSIHSPYPLIFSVFVHSFFPFTSSSYISHSSFHHLFLSVYLFIHSSLVVRCLIPPLPPSLGIISFPAFVIY